MGLSVARLLRSCQTPFGALTDAALVAYALWTIAANAAVAAGGGARSLLLAFVIAGSIASALIWGVATRPALRAAYFADLVDEPVAPRAPLTRAGVIAVSGLFALSIVAWLATRNPWLAWAGSIACVLFAALHALRASPSIVGEEAGRPLAPLTSVERTALHALALACAVFSLLVVRPRGDDTFYLNMALSVVEYPQQALLSLKNLHGPASDTLAAQRMFAAYRVHSFELLGGLIGYVSGLDPVAVIHLGFATALCWLTPFAVARLMRLLLPRAWLLGVVTVVLFYMIEGTAARGYANHALVRMFNGKSALLTLALPLICACGLRYGSRASGMRWSLLAASQIAAVGLSSTGLWLAPTLAMVSVVAGTRQLRRLPWRVGGSLLSSAYVLALGLWVLGQLGAGVSDPGEVEARTETVQAAEAAPNLPPMFVELADAVTVVFGPERTAIALLGVLWLASLLAPNALGLRLLSLLSSVLVLGFGNPFLSRMIARFVTGATTYQRIFWLLPVAVGTGVCCGVLFCRLRVRFEVATSLSLSLAALAAFFAVATQRLVVSEANQAKLQFPPALKLWTRARSEAEAICHWAPAGDYVLASQAVSLQLPMLRACGYPLATFDRWLSAPEPEKQTRNDLVRLVDERQDIAIDKVPWFIGALARYHVDTVVLSREAARNTRVKAMIRLADYERVAAFDWDQIFVRTRPATRAEYESVGRNVCENSPRDGNVLASFGVSAVLERRKCMPAVAAPARVLGASRAEFDDLLTLERVVYMASQPSAASRAQVGASIDRRRISVVVLSEQAKGNKWLKASLAKRGFRKARGVKGYSVLERVLPPATP